jgi:hypothetical protein
VTDPYDRRVDELAAELLMPISPLLDHDRERRIHDLLDLVAGVVMEQDRVVRQRYGARSGHSAAKLDRSRLRVVGEFDGAGVL